MKLSCFIQTSSFSKSHFLQRILLNIFVSFREKNTSPINSGRFLDFGFPVGQEQVPEYKAASAIGNESVVVWDGPLTHEILRLNPPIFWGDGTRWDSCGTLGGICYLFRLIWWGGETKKKYATSDQHQSEATSISTFWFFLLARKTWSYVAEQIVFSQGRQLNKSYKGLPHKLLGKFWKFSLKCMSNSGESESVGNQMKTRKLKHLSKNDSVFRGSTAISHIKIIQNCIIYYNSQKRCLINRNSRCFFSFQGEPKKVIKAKRHWGCRPLSVSLVVRILRRTSRSSIAFYDAMVLVRFPPRCQKHINRRGVEILGSWGTPSLSLNNPLQKRALSYFLAGGVLWHCGGLPLDSHDCRNFLTQRWKGILGSFHKSWHKRFEFYWDQRGLNFADFPQMLYRQSAFQCSYEMRLMKLAIFVMWLFITWGGCLHLKVSVFCWVFCMWPYWWILIFVLICHDSTAGAAHWRQARGWT